MKYEFQGKFYNTLSSCYESNKDKIPVSINIVRKRLKEGWPLEKAFLTAKYEFQGKLYNTLSSCYESNKDKITVGIATIRNRLKEGWPLEKALLTPKQKTLETRLGSHIVEGIEFLNLPEIADAYGLPKTTIYKRYAKGFRGDDLVPPKKRKTYKKPTPKEKKRFLAGGASYKSVSEACNKLDVKVTTYYHRIARGLSKEQALGLEPVTDNRSQRYKNCEVEGDIFTIKELIEKYSVPESTVKDRLKRGASIRQAIGLDPIGKGELIKQKDVQTQKRKRVMLKVGGKIYNSYKSLADDYNLPAYKVRQRIVDYGYTPEDAVLAEGKSKPIKFKGKYYKSSVEMADAFGIKDTIFQSRLASGWTLEEATGVRERPSSTSIEYEGKHFDSIKNLAENVGISVIALYRRIRSGMTVEEAVSAGERMTSAGRYNQAILERDHELASTPSYLYFASFVIDGNTKYKIGITSKSPEIRLRAESYRFEIIKVVEDTLLNCFLLEQDLLDLLSDKRDTSVRSELMDGYTEVLNLDDDDVAVVLELLNLT